MDGRVEGVLLRVLSMKSLAYSDICGLVGNYS